MATRTLLLAAVLFFALPFCIAPAAEPPSLDELLKLYKELGLPLPPKDAKLVRFERSAYETVNGKDVRKTNYYLAFQIKPGSAKEGPIFMEACDEVRGDDQSKPQVVLPDPNAVDGIRFYSGEALLLAIQCHSRGWRKLAERAFGVYQKDEKDAPQTILLQTAWYYWLRQVTKPKIDRAPAAQHLRQVMRLDKEFDSKENRIFLKSLELAIVPSRAKPGSNESLIDDLVNLNDEEEEYDDEYWWRPNKRITALLQRGFDTVPELVKHVDDPRLTRMSTSEWGADPPSYYVGDAVSDLLRRLIGRPTEHDWRPGVERRYIDKAKVQKWFDEAKKVGEEKYVVEHVLFPTDSEFCRGINYLQLSLILAKYPKHLPAIYRKILDSYPESPPVLAQAIKMSDLPVREKLNLLVHAAKNREASQRYAGLRALSALDKREFDNMLPAAIEALPKDVGPWCGGGPDELHIVLLADNCDNPKVWTALEKVARNAKVSYRVMILQELSDAYQAEVKRIERMRLLASFLDDTVVYDREKNKERNPFFEPRKYPKLEVRDFVALRLADMLGMKVETNPKRTPEEWAKLRAKVREELRRAEKK